MQPNAKRRTGDIVKSIGSGELVEAYVPRPLPPDPPLDLARLLPPLAKAEQAVGRLDGVTSILPSTGLFLYMYVRKEALLSSQIEGTQSSLSDLLLLETNETPFVSVDDVAEVSNYVVAMRHGLKRLEDGFPLSLRLVREMHEKLLSSGRGSSKQPGEFRRTQNWIGGTRPGNALFVPPPPERVMDCMGDLEKFLHDRTTFSALIRAALAHVQFETIHPFLDGNGRLGRLLITLMLCEDGTLQEPVLYLSLHLKANRSRYYELLQEVRHHGNWEDWIEFFLDGVTDTALQGVDTARRLIGLFEEDRVKISKLRRAAASALRVHTELQRNPLRSVPMLAKGLGISQPTAQSALDHLMRLGIVREVTGQRRNRIYEYSRYLRILDEGTEPLRP
jgi:Fic family protein